MKLSLKLTGDARFPGSATSVPGGGDDGDGVPDGAQDGGENPPAAAVPTFAAVAPLFATHCKSCHDWAGDEAQAAQRAAASKQRIEAGDMPPDPAVLPDADKATLLDWMRAKAKG